MTEMASLGVNFCFVLSKLTQIFQIFIRHFIVFVFRIFIIFVRIVYRIWNFVANFVPLELYYRITV